MGGGTVSLWRALQQSSTGQVLDPRVQLLVTRMRVDRRSSAGSRALQTSATEEGLARYS